MRHRPSISFILLLAIGCASPNVQGNQPEEKNPVLEARAVALALEALWMPAGYCRCL